VLSAVLFDLDGTLLDIDLDPFLNDYFAVLAPVVADVLGHDPEDSTGLRAVIAATESMSGIHVGQTNRDAFNAEFERLTGTDLRAPELQALLDSFYAQTFPKLRGSTEPLPGAVEAVETALGLGLKVAIATNPIFPICAVRERMRWAGLEHSGVHVVTAYEEMCATKPHATYYTQTAELLGVDPRTCIMVGDDRVLDMSAADIGMRTFYVGDGSTPACDWSGSLDQLADLLTRLTD